MAREVHSLYAYSRCHRQLATATAEHARHQARLDDLRRQYDENDARRRSTIAELRRCYMRASQIITHELDAIARERSELERQIEAQDDAVAASAAERKRAQDRADQLRATGVDADSFPTIAQAMRMATAGAPPEAAPSASEAAPPPAPPSSLLELTPNTTEVIMRSLGDLLADPAPPEPGDVGAERGAVPDASGKMDLTNLLAMDMTDEEYSRVLSSIVPDAVAMPPPPPPPSPPPLEFSEWPLDDKPFNVIVNRAQDSAPPFKRPRIGSSPP